MHWSERNDGYYAVARVPDGWIVVLRGWGDTTEPEALEQAQHNAVRDHADPASVEILDGAAAIARYPDAVQGWWAKHRHYLETEGTVGCITPNVMILRINP